MNFRRRSVRRTGLGIAGTLMGVSMLFTAQMFGELHVPFEVQALPPLPTVQLRPENEWTDHDVFIPADPTEVDLGVRRVPDRPADPILTDTYGLSLARMDPPPIPVNGPAWGFGPVGSEREDIWIPPGALARYADSYAVNPPGPPNIPIPPPPPPNDDGPGGGGHPPVVPPIQPSIPEPGGLALLAAATWLLSCGRRDPAA